MSFVAKTGVLANEASEGPLPGIALQCPRNASEWFVGYPDLAALKRSGLVLRWIPEVTPNARRTGG